MLPNLLDSGIITCVWKLPVHVFVTGFVMTFTTPPMASLPQSVLIGPLITSILSIADNGGIKVLYTPTPRFAVATSPLGF